MSYENDPDVNAFSITKPQYSVDDVKKMVFGQESNFGKANTSKANYAGAIGPMQITEPTFLGLKKQGLIPANYDINNPEHTKKAGEILIEDAYKRHKGDADKVLAEYYAGPKAIKNDTIDTSLRDLKNPKAPNVGQYIEQAKNKLNAYETDPDIQAFTYNPQKQVEKPKGFFQELVEPLQGISYEGFKKESMLPKIANVIATSMTGTDEEKIALAKQAEQKAIQLAGGIKEFSKHPIESIKQVTNQIVEHPGQFLGQTIKGIIYDPETLLPVGLGTKVAKGATVSEQLSAQAAKRASIGAAGTSNKSILQAAMDIASPELKKDLTEKFAKGETHLLNEQALTHQLEADQLPIPVRLTEGQATQNPSLISRERNERGFKEQYVQRFNEQNKALADNAFALKEITAPSVTTTDHVADAQEIIDAINQKKKNNVQATQDAYQVLADKNGGKFPVDGKKFAENAIRTLGEEDRFDYLPNSMQKRLNEYANGKKEMNFNLFRNLDSDLSAEIRKAQSANDGNAVYALSKVKDELLNLPLSQETEVLKPFLTKAKATAKADFDLEKYNKAYKDVVGGKADTKDLIPSLVLRSKNTDFANTLNLLSDNPKALENLRSGTLDYLLKDSTDASGNFSAAKFTKHINNLDVNKKLFALFGENTETIRNLSKTAQRIEARPKGSFVNESNTLTGLGAFAKEYAGKALEKIPGVKTVTAPITVVKDILQERAAKKQLEESLKPGAGIKLKDIGKK